ncbi:MAG: insulinase family protein, partial [Muribaculaceae bacterium]|nr:insulinase family protein [Muribaculaceae bacterium]
VMGCVLGNRYSNDRHVISLLTNILGGPGMNSILNVALREKRGLVYSVDASSTMMADTGLFTVYFGCDPKDTIMCKDIVMEKIHRLAEDGMTYCALKAAKKQYLGQLAVASDNRENVAISTGRAALFYNSVQTTNEIISKVESISVDQIRNVASVLTNMSALTLQ